MTKTLRGASRIEQKKPPKKKQRKKINKEDIKKNLLITFKLIVIFSFLSLLYYLWITIAKPAIEKPINSIVVVADSKEVENSQIKEIIDNSVIGKSIFTMNANDLINQLSSLDWVDKVDIIRTYPDKLSISMTFQKPIARWGDDTLLSDSNNLFKIKNNLDYTYLPSLFAPTMERNKILDNFRMISKLLQPIESPVKSFVFSESGSLDITLDNGVALKFGKKNFMNKIVNMLSIYQHSLIDKKDSIEYIDLRYPNGIAVKFKEELNEEKKI